MTQLLRRLKARIVSLHWAVKHLICYEIQLQVSAGSCAEGLTAVSFSFSVVFRVTFELPGAASLISGSILAEALLLSASHL